MGLPILDIKNNKVREIELSADLQEKVNKAVLYYALKASRNALRHGTSQVKDRSAINKTNKKIYKQKGTGNARHASRKANIFVGGGSAHGPHPRSYVEKVNKKFKKISYTEVLKYLIQNNLLKVLESFSLDKPSTKAASQVLKTLGLNKALVIVSKDNQNMKLSFRNLKDVKVINEENINFYDALRYNALVLDLESFEKIKTRYLS